MCILHYLGISHHNRNDDKIPIRKVKCRSSHIIAELTFNTPKMNLDEAKDSSNKISNNVS